MPQMTLRPDPTFHATPRLAMEAPAETLAFTLMLSPDGSRPDGLAVVDMDPKSDTYGQIVHSPMRPATGDDFHVVAGRERDVRGLEDGHHRPGPGRGGRPAGPAEGLRRD